MKKLSTLFYECVYVGNWQTINDVDYKFIENEKEHTLEIYFMGSSQTLDWVRNFMFPSKPYKDMQIPYRVHRGFLAAWKEVEDIIIAKICEKTINDYKWKHIITVGYSHGGALTFFTTEAIWYHRPDLRNGGFKSFAFESPRVFSSFKVPKNLKERWDNMTVVRVNNDLVTHCPPILFGFTHAGKLLKIKGDTSIVLKHIPKCIKSHYPEVVYNALMNWENNFSKNKLLIY